MSSDPFSPFVIEEHQQTVLFQAVAEYPPSLLLGTEIPNDGTFCPIEFKAIESPPFPYGQAMDCLMHWMEKFTNPRWIFKLTPVHHQKSPAQTGSTIIPSLPDSLATAQPKCPAAASMPTSTETFAEAASTG